MPRMLLAVPPAFFRAPTCAPSVGPESIWRQARRPRTRLTTAARPRPGNPPHPSPVRAPGRIASEADRLRHAVSVNTPGAAACTRAPPSKPSRADRSPATGSGRGRSPPRTPPTAAGGARARGPRSRSPAPAAGPISGVARQCHRVGSATPLWCTRMYSWTARKVCSICCDAEDAQCLDSNGTFE